MASDWVTIREQQLSEAEPKRGNHQGHNFHSPRRLPWLTYCLGCGHVPLKNDISRLITRLGCDFERDPRYQQWAGSKKI